MTWSKGFGSENNKSVFYSITANGDGFLACGTKALSDKQVAWLMKIDFAGNLQWEKTYSQMNSSTRAVPQADGGNVLVGNSASGSTIALSKVSADGTLISSTNLPWLGGDYFISQLQGAAFRTGKSGLVLVPTTTNGYAYAIALEGFSILAKILAANGGLSYTGVVDGDSAPVVFGQSNDKAFIGRFDAFANTTVSKFQPKLNGQNAASVMVDSLSGAIVVVSGSGTLLRTDPWGNATCTTSGPCAAKTLATCADTNPCTADLCDAAHNGCYHTNRPETSPCATGKTCKSGTCQ